MTFVTTLGDYFTFFAFVIITQQYFQNTILSAYCTVAKSAAIAAAGIFIPKILPGFKSRTLFVGSQFASALFLFAFCFALYFKKINSPLLIYMVLFLTTFLWQVFVAARETLSKAITTSNEDHRAKTGQLLSGMLLAQTLGPLLALFVIIKFGAVPAILVDAFSFLICGIMGLGIKNSPKFQPGASLFRPFRYLSQRPMLLRIFLLRSVGFWVPVAIANLLVFEFATQKFQGFLGGSSAILGAAVLTSICGLGAWIGNGAVANNWMGLKELGDGRIAFFAGILMGLVFLMFISPSLGAIGLCVLYFLRTLGTGANAISTQTIRRKLTDNTEFAEIVSLEIVVGRTADWLVGSIAALLIANWHVSPNSLVIFAALWLLVTAGFYLEFDRKEQLAFT